MTLKRKIAGLDFKHPVIAAPGPNVELNIVREVAPFQGIPVTKTISVRACEPPKQNMAYVKGSVPAFLNKEGHSEFPLAAWAEKLEEMQRAGFSPIASVGYTAEDVWIVREILQDLVAGWEVSTHYTTPQKSMQTVRTLVESGKPVFLKVSPNGFLPKPGEVVAEDFEAKLNEYVRSFESLGVAGFVGINSLGPTNVRYGERHALAGKLALGGNAWLSGPRIRRVGLTFVDRIAGNLPVGGVGAISTYKDALAFMAYGADFVGVCTEAILKGPEVYTKIAEGIGKFMEKIASRLSACGLDYVV